MNFLTKWVELFVATNPSKVVGLVQMAPILGGTSHSIPYIQFSLAINMHKIFHIFTNIIVNFLIMGYNSIYFS